MTDSLKNLLFQLVKQAKQDMERRFAKAGISITPFEYGILSVLKHQPSTLAEIAKKLGIRSSSALPYVDSLAKKDVIVRQADPKDRRKIALNLTRKGQNLVTSVLKEHPKDILSQSFKKLSKQKQTQLISLLSELTKNLSLYE